MIIDALWFQRAGQVGRQVMALYIENKLAVSKGFNGGIRLKNGFRRQVKKAAVNTLRGINTIECE